jgi:hypothetical protein
MKGSMLLVAGVVIMVVAFVVALIVWAGIGRKQRELETRLKMASDPDYVTASMAVHQAKKQERKLLDDSGALTGSSVSSTGNNNGGTTSGNPDPGVTDSGDR